MSCNPRTGRIHRTLFPAFGVTLVLVMAALFRTDVSPKASAWRERKVLLGHAGNVLTMVFSPDGQMLAWQVYEKGAAWVTLANTVTGKQVGSVPFSQAKSPASWRGPPVTMRQAFAFSADGKP